MFKKRLHLNLDSMIAKVHESFSKVPDHRPNQVKGKITLQDTLMSAFAMMHLKYSNLLEFDKERKTPELQHNLKSLYRVKGRAPCDTYMRTILDPVSPDHLRDPFSELFSDVQRGGALKPFRFGSSNSFNSRYLLAVDGTGLYYSGKCQCNGCCVKNKGKTNESYYHQMLAGCLVHPDLSVVLPLAPEPIVQQDGSTKNDCEKNALKRFLAHVKREHPHIKLVILLDGLYADVPTIQLIRQYGWNFIIIAKEGNHPSLFKAVEALDKAEKVSRYEQKDDQGRQHWYSYANEVPLNKSNLGVTVNVLDYVEIDKKEVRRSWSWVTDIELNDETVIEVAKGGRCRWRIENETFNTLKNQGYELEHNYGHGKQHLSTNLAYLTFLAFLVDQIQQLCCPIFQLALKERAKGTRSYMWKLILRYFMSWIIDDWDELFSAMTKGTRPTRINLNTSINLDTS